MFFFQFEIILNGIVSSFRFIWIPMLWIYGHNNYTFIAGIDFRRQNLTSTDVSFWRLMSVPALKVANRRTPASPLSMTLPNTEESLWDVEQFQRLFRNWCWHSETPILAPLTTDTITSGCVRHRRRWGVNRPGMLSQMTPDPTMDRECTGSWLRYLEIQGR